MQTPNLPFLRATEYGLQCFVAGELTAHDPDDYLMKLKAACPTIDEITLLYAAEALGTFRAAKYLATSVMIGVAAESMLVRLVKSTSSALGADERRAKFDKVTPKPSTTRSSQG